MQFSINFTVILGDIGSRLIGDIHVMQAELVFHVVVLHKRMFINVADEAYYTNNILTFIIVSWHKLVSNFIA